MNLNTNTATHNGDTVNGSYFEMGNVNVKAGGMQLMSDVGKNRVDINKMTNEAGGTTVFMAPQKLMNLNTNTATHNGDTVNGSYFEMGNVNVKKGGMQLMSDVGKNRVDINKMTNEAGGTTVFMAPQKLINLNTNTATHNGDTVNGSYFEMGNVNVKKGGMQLMSDVGKNRVDINKMTNEAGGTTVFMAPQKL